MTFRDDHEAALARAQALQAELERSEAERRRLEEEVAELKAPKAPEREPEPPAEERPRRSSTAPRMSSATRVKILWWVAGGLAAVIFVVVVNLGDCTRREAHDAWRARVEAQQAHKDRWLALIRVEPCVRRVVDDQARRIELDFTHPEQVDGYWISQLVSNCTDGARKMSTDPQLAPEVREALSRWLAAERTLAQPVEQARTYFSEGDWKEDAGAGGRARWDAVKRELAHRLAVMGSVRSAALPALRAEMRRLQSEHAAARGKDEVWWRIELELALWAIDDAAFQAMGRYEGVPVRPVDEDTRAATAVQAQVVALLAAAQQAPIEVRRDLREVDWITGPLADGVPPRGETPFWHLHMFGLLDTTWERPPAMPPEPGPEPDYHPD